MLTKSEIQARYFNELNEQARDQAIQNMSNINVDHDWYESIYDDAEQVGIQITGFDIGRSYKIQADLLWSVDEIADKIMETHGEQCDTWETAKRYLETEQDAAEFEAEIKNDYLFMLKMEYEYRTTEAAIVETIEANHYLFDNSGNLLPITTYTGNHPNAGKTTIRIGTVEIELNLDN